MQNITAWFQSVDRDRYALVKICGILSYLLHIRSGEISAAELSQLNFNNRILGLEPARQLIASTCCTIFYH